MSLDPHVIADDHEGRRAAKLAELERRVRSLETTPKVQTGAGAPTGSPRDGTLYVDTAALRLYVRSGGAWRYAGLT